MRAIPPAILTPYGKATPVAAGRPPSGSNPAFVYLASLKPSGRVVMAGSLDIVARKLGAKNARSPCPGRACATSTWSLFVSGRLSRSSQQQPTATWPRSRGRCDRLGAWVNFLAKSLSAFAISSLSTGPYSIVRNPMYSSAAVFFIGMSLALRSYGGLVSRSKAARLRGIPRQSPLAFDTGYLLIL
jgi:hypothetical protein